MNNKTPVLVLNPKCATTSIRAALNYRPPRTHHIHLPLKHPRLQTFLRRSENPWVGCPVRDPLERAVSCYHFWRKPRKRSVRENEVLQVFANALTCSEFWERIDISELARTVPHFRTQFSYIQGCEDQVDQFIRFERLNQDFETYCLNLGKTNPPKLPHKFGTRHKSPLDELSDKAVKKIVEYYSIDYERFAYVKP